MTSRFLGSGDDTKYHLLAGFDTVDETASGGSRQGAGFSILQITEQVRLALSAAILNATSASRGSVVDPLSAPTFRL